MRRLSLVFGLAATGLFAQDVGDRNIVLQEISIPQMPGLHSFAWAQHNGEWLMLGGRTEGLHQRQPFAAFGVAGSNTSVYVVNPETKQLWSAPMSTLPAAVYQQLQSTNMEFGQVDDVLYIIGGYGYSALASDHITHPRLTAVDVSATIAAIKNSQPIAPNFRSLQDERMAVTGGYLGRLGDQFMLVGGQRFIGRYNPMGPTSGPGFFQEYTNAIRRFRIVDSGTALSIADFSEVVDTLELHRRDFNMVSQIFPDGSQGFTAFSGVFQYGADIPWLNTVDISATDYTVVPVFEQLLNQYHSAHMPVYSTAEGRMQTVFFGGIGRYYFNANGQLVDDSDVPFTNTISTVLREADGSMEEYALGEMPALLGAGAEFMENRLLPLIFGDILDLDALVGDTVLAGHIVGGIQSSARNIFFVNTGTQSNASARIFRVLLVRDNSTGIEDANEEGSELLSVASAEGSLMVSLDLPHAAMVELDLLDSSGRVIRSVFTGRMVPGTQRLRADVSDLATGAYLLRMTAGELQHTVRFVR